jgi:dihydroorotase
MRAKPFQGVTVISGGRVIDPSQGIDRADDLTISAGQIESIGPGSDRQRTIDATGLLVCPGLIDAHVHLREPGGEDQETIETGTRGAAAGGFTAVACMPNTRPPIADAEILRFVLDRARQAGHCRVHPVAAMTIDSRGESASDLAGLQEAGAIAFSDDGRGVDNSAVMAAVVKAARECGALLIQHCEDHALAGGGCINLGVVSDELGLPGIDPRAEEAMLARDLDFIRENPARYHVAHVSTQGSVELIRQAKAAGLPVTAEVAVHHLVLTERAVHDWGVNAKMNPPLRTEADVAACQAGVCDGTIDCIVTDHAPHTAEAKARGLREAPFGITGLETAWALSHAALVGAGQLGLPDLVDRMSCGPARVLGLDQEGSLRVGSAADVVLIDPDARWVVDANTVFSKSNNTPFWGWKLTQRPVATVVGGRVCSMAAGYTQRLSGFDSMPA